MREYTTEELMELMIECNQYNGSFEYIYCYDVYEIDDILNGIKIENLINMVHFGDYNPSCNYFRFDGYGNIESVHDSDYMDEIEDARDEILEVAKDLGIID